MGKGLCAVVVALTAMASLIGAAGASASVDFGETCTATGPAPGDYSLTTLEGRPGQQLTAPVSGVLTEARMQVDLPLPFSTIPVEVKLLRAVGGTTYENVGETTIEASVSGLTTTKTRIPVQAGDRFGLHGLPSTHEGSEVPGFSPLCGGTEYDGEGVLGAVEGDVSQGSSAEFEEVTEGQVPLAGTIEPDVDHDGYGDETQDACPTNAATQAACPAAPVPPAPIALDVFPVQRARALLVLATTDQPASVEVSGTIKLPSIGRHGVGAKKSSKRRHRKAKTLKLTAKPVASRPGHFSQIKLKYPAKLKRALKRLPRSKKLTLRVGANTKNAAGLVTRKLFRVKLKGWSHARRRG